MSRERNSSRHAIEAHTGDIAGTLDAHFLTTEHHWTTEGCLFEHIFGGNSSWIWLKMDQTMKEPG